MKPRNRPIARTPLALRPARGVALLGIVAIFAFGAGSTVSAQVEEEAQPATEQAAPVAEDPTAAEATEPAEAPEATEATESTEPEGKDEEGPLRIHGAFGAEFDGRWSDRDEDFDLEQSLQFQIDHRDLPNVHLRGSLWFIENVHEADEESGLVGLSGAGQDDLIRPLYLYVDVDDLWGKSTLRIGRQRILEGPTYNRLDGLYFNQTQPWGNWYVFGGWRASLYEESHNDPAFGGGVSLRLTPKTRVALDSYYVDEERNNTPDYHRYRLTNWLYPDYPRDRTDSVDDTLVAFTLWQDITQNLRFYGRYTWYEETGDDLRLELTGYVPSWNLTYQVAYRRLFGDSTDTLSDTTAYYRIFGSQAEYDNILFSLNKAFGERYSLSFETEIQSADDSPYDDYNRDYTRYALTGTATELFWKSDLTLSVEKWAVAGDEDSWAITGELSRSFNKIDVALGVDYSRWVDEFDAYNFWPLWRNQARAVLNVNQNVSNAFYNNNFFVRLMDVNEVTTRENVWALYTNWRWHIQDDQDLFLDVSYERDDSGDSPYWRLRGGYSIRF